MVTGSFPGVKRPGRGTDHPSPSDAEVTNEWSYTPTPLWALGTCYRANLVWFNLVYICTVHTAVLFQSLAAIYCQTQHVKYYQEHTTLVTCFGLHCSHLQALRKPRTNTSYCTWV
jgi:hypothetical protein